LISSACLFFLSFTLGGDNGVRKFSLSSFLDFVLLSYWFHVLNLPITFLCTLLSLRVPTLVGAKQSPNSPRKGFATWYKNNPFSFSMLSAIRSSLTALYALNGFYFHALCSQLFALKGKEVVSYEMTEINISHF